MIPTRREQNNMKNKKDAKTENINIKQQQPTTTISTTNSSNNKDNNNNNQNIQETKEKILSNSKIMINIETEQEEKEFKNSDFYRHLHKNGRTNLLLNANGQWEQWTRITCPPRPVQKQFFKPTVWKAPETEM